MGYLYDVYERFFSSENINEYSPEEHWQEKLSKNYNLKGVGQDYFSVYYNTYLYKRKKDTLDRILEDSEISLEDCKVLDIGIGTGFFIEYYNKKTNKIWGIDITDKSVSEMRNNYSNLNFLKRDVGQDIDLEQRFDIINCFDVIYHVTDKSRYKTAVENIINHLKEDGIAIITESYNDESDEHFKFRGEELENILSEKRNVEIKEIVPLYSVMNRVYFGRLPPLKFIDSMLSPFYFYLDKFLTNEKRSNMQIFVIRKIPEKT